MNAIFGIIYIISIIFLIFTNPDGVLSAMLSGGEKALSLTLKMTVIYAVWLGVFELLEQSGLASKLAKLIKPLNRFLFGKIPDKANDFISINVSANMLNSSGEVLTTYRIYFAGVLLLLPILGIFIHRLRAR